MKTEHEITALLTRAADERRVDVDPLWTRTQERLAEPATVRDYRAARRRRASVIGAVAATAVIAGSAVVVGSLRDDRRSGSPTEHGPATSSGTSHPRSRLADDVLRLHRVRLPANQRHVEVTTVVDQEGEHYSGPTVGLGPVHLAGETGAVVVSAGQYLQSGQPIGRFVSADFVSHDQSVDQAIRSAAHGVAFEPTSLTSRRPRPQYLWGYDDHPDVFADRLVLTMGAGPEVRRWVVRFTDGSSVAAQRFAVPGGGGALFILVGPHLPDVWGRLKDVSWYGPGGTLLHRSDGGGGLP